jgi:predicted permease
MSGLIQDLRHALRALRKSPGFAAVAVVSLALGIGANAAAFSIVSSMLLRSLPVEDPARVVALFGRREGQPPLPFSYADYQSYRALGDVFEGLAAHTGTQVSLQGRERAEMVWGEMVTDNYFQVVGARLATGRGFLPEEGVEGARPAAVLGHGLWLRRFGGDPAVVGGTLRLNGREFTIVGVAPEGFVGTRLFSFAPEIFVPLGQHERLRPETAGWLDDPATSWLSVVGRLKPGVTLERAQAAASALATAQAREDSQRQGLGVRLYANRTLINPWILDPAVLQRMAALLLLAMSLVLAIACANVANLLLTRAAGRRREIAVRLSLGAGRGRLVRLLLTESFVLAALGAAAGLLFAVWMVDLSRGFRPTLDFATAFVLRVDGHVLAYTAAVSVVTALVFGLVPALQAARTSLVPALKDESAASVGTRSRAREVLVTVQIALALLLLVGAGLFVRSFRNAQAIDPGFDPQGVLLASVHLGMQGYDDVRQVEFRERVLRDLSALPGVRSASLAFPLPLDAYSRSMGVTLEGGATVRESERPDVFESMVGPGYFATMRTPILRGRALDERDRAGAPPVAVVNEAFARRFWPGRDALGRRFSLDGDEGPWVEVVGIARDGKYLTLGESPRPYLFVPLAQRPSPRLTILVRTEGNPEELLPSVRAALQRLDPALPLYAVRTLRQQMETPLSGAQSGAATVGLFGALALILAAAGIYGVVSYAVAQRTREIGVRVALGARKADVVGMVLRRGAGMASVGIALGLVGASVLGRSLSGFLYGISGMDWPTYAAIAALLAGVTLLASWIPARRAARVDPLKALRAE